MNTYVPPKPSLIDTVEHDVFYGLCAHLNEVLTDDQPCDNQLTNSIKWLKDNGHDVDVYTNFLTSNGGFCDCEVLMNVRCHIGDWLQYVFE